MVDETEFEIIDTDNESRMNDSNKSDAVYCFTCGGDKDLEFIGCYASSDEYACRTCGVTFMWPT
jgi:hypothetical protein